MEPDNGDDSFDEQIGRSAAGKNTWPEYLNNPLVETD